MLAVKSCLSTKQISFSLLTFLNAFFFSTINNDYCNICRVRNCSFLVANVTKNQVLATRISQVVPCMQLTLSLLITDLHLQSKQRQLLLSCCAFFFSKFLVSTDLLFGNRKLALSPHFRKDKFGPRCIILCICFLQHV